MKMYSSGEFAKLIGVTRKTVQSWDNSKKLVAHRSPGNHRYYTQDDVNHYLGIDTPAQPKIYLYARVSSRTQLDDLQHQVIYLQTYAIKHHYQVEQLIQEQGSGLNYNRKKWNWLVSQAIADKHIKVVVTYPDRFIRFGFDWFQRLFKDHGSEIEVINQQKLSANQELVTDLISIIQVFSSKLYGLRSYKNKLKGDVHRGKFNNTDTNS